MTRPALGDAIRGFYAVLDRDDEALARALVAEARVLQVRIKPPGGTQRAAPRSSDADLAGVVGEAGRGLEPRQRHSEGGDRTGLPGASEAARGVDTATLVRIARMARRICDEVGAALIVNDRLDVALAVGADGVHLGQDDLPIADARRIAGRLWIGVSTHDVDQVERACAAGADYLGFGPVFATTTKERPDPVQGVSALAAAVVVAGATPVVAIGGIVPEVAPELYRVGASAICAIGAVNHARDPRAAARRFRRVDATHT